MAWSWIQPICQICYDARYPSPQPGRLAEHARVVEKCAYCGGETVSGLYVRDDPATVTYPRMTD